jgi:hypothetical protein
MRTTISIRKNIYAEMKEEAEKDFITPSQLIRQMWRDYKKCNRCDTPGCASPEKADAPNNSDLDCSNK